MKSKKTKFLVVVLVILIIITGVLLAIKILNNPSKNQKPSNNVISLGIDNVKIKDEDKIQIYNGNDRPIAVMIDNHKGARPQVGLNDAYIVYEIIVEGGETRLMPVFKGKDLSKIGPVRSSRHYFLDYAMENNAIYVHFGWSPQAEADISKYKVNNINGIQEGENSFWRVKDKKAPHNVVTNTKKILEIANTKKYKTTSNEKSILNYQKESVELEEGIPAVNIQIPYSEQNVVSYKYNEQTKKYERYEKNGKQIDWDTKDVIATKNIIITFAENYTLNDGENKGRQGLKNIGNKKGYYITNGKAIEIVCEKSSRTEKTIYKDLLGNQIKVNDGNTFIQICPIDANITIK